MGPFNGYWGIGKQDDRVLSLYNLDIKGVYLTVGIRWVKAVRGCCGMGSVPPEDTIQDKK